MTAKTPKPTLGQLLASYVAPREMIDPEPVTPMELSPKQRRILDLIAAGLPDKAIAGELSCSSHTIGSQVRRLFDKLRVHSRAEAAYLLGMHVAQTRDTQTCDKTGRRVCRKMRAL